MIWTDSVINYKRTDAELEELILFLVLVAGKQANRTAYLLERFLEGNLDRPFDYIRELIKNNSLDSELRKHKTGNYTKTEKAFKQLVDNYSGSDLRKITRDELLKIHGIGLKSASCFLLWTKESAKNSYAALDTHILAFLREELKLKTPKSTPSKNEYLKLEKIFLTYARSLKRDAASLDLEIWKSRRV